MFGRLGTVWAECGLDTTKLDMGVARAKASMTGLSGTAGSMTHAFKNLALGVGLIGGAVAAAGVKLAADFDRVAREVNTMADLSEKDFQRMKQDILDLSRTTIYSAKEMMQGMCYYGSDNSNGIPFNDLGLVKAIFLPLNPIFGLRSNISIPRFSRILISASISSVKREI